MEINRVKGQITVLISRLDVLQKDIQLSPAEIKDMEVLEVSTCKFFELNDTNIEEIFYIGLT